MEATQVLSLVFLDLFLQYVAMKRALLVFENRLRIC